MKSSIYWNTLQVVQYWLNPGIYGSGTSFYNAKTDMTTFRIDHHMHQQCFIQLSQVSDSGPSWLSCFNFPINFSPEQMNVHPLCLKFQWVFLRFPFFSIDYKGLIRTFYGFWLNHENIYTVEDLLWVKNGTILFLRSKWVFHDLLQYLTSHQTIGCKH